MIPSEMHTPPDTNAARPPRRSPGVLLIIVGLSVLAGWGGRRVFGPATTESRSGEPASAVAGAALSRGAVLYQIHCAKCHGSEGRGDPESMARQRPPPRDFAERPWRHEMTLDSIRRVIADGIPGTSMAAQRAALKSDELDLLAEHVLNLVQQLPAVERTFTPEQQPLVSLGFDIERRPSPPPALTLQDARGGSVSVAGFKGAWVLLEFWGLSCEPCRKALPALQRLSIAELGGRLKIFPICADADDADAAQQALAQIAPGLTAYVDATGIGIAQFGIQALPMAWLIDPDGRVQATHVGSIDWDHMAARFALEALLASTPSPGPQKLSPELPGLHNVYQVAEGIISGSEPEGDEGFASLARLGITTVVSVDGAVPNLETAHKRGMRYVHLPIGYDGVPAETGLALARVAREAPRPIYVHCHHGKHRGPAAAAVACVAAGKLSPHDALRILETAGTGKEYAGLWRDVAAFLRPAPDAVLPELVEAAEVDSLTAAMAHVDRRFDELKLCRDANWQTPRDHPDLVPAQAALLVREALHEALRTTSKDRFDRQFREWLSAAEDHAAQVEAHLRESQPEAASAGLRALEAACKQCHTRYRN